MANALTAWELLQYGCDRVTASYDINADSITELLEAVGEANARRVEIVAHCHMPIFHTEHCVFARFLSNGNSYLDCGHVCTGHNVHLRDQTGADNLVLADMGCRNTVFAAQAQRYVNISNKVPLLHSILSNLCSSYPCPKWCSFDQGLGGSWCQPFSRRVGRRVPRRY